MAIAAPRDPGTQTAPSRLKSFSRKAAAAILLLSITAGLLWWSAPVLLAPAEDFLQGPGGAVAYVSLANQIREQSAAFWAGKDIEIRLSEAEFSGMLSSALLTGRKPEDPIQRIRGSLDGGEITVEAVIHLPYEPVPERLRGPLGLRLRLNPVVTEHGVVRFRITRAFAGRIPISPSLIRWAGRLVPIHRPGLDAREATISLPLGDMVSQTLGRKLQIKRFSAENGHLNLTIAMPVSH
jgi:hypothetical protein